MDDVEIHTSGPIFDGRAEAAAWRMSTEIADEVARYAEIFVQYKLASSLKHPTGYYQSQVRKTKVDVTAFRVHDGGVVYGPWLEGKGSRNFPVTRFRGYHSFEEAKRATNREAARIAAPIVAKHLREMQ